MKMRKQIFVLCMIFSLLSAFLYAQGAGGPSGQQGGGGQPTAPQGQPATPQGGQGASSGQKQPAPQGQNATSSSASNYTQGQSTDLYLYHGKRVSANHEPFSVVLVKSTKTEIQVFFNIPLDPLTFTHEAIFIDGRPLDSDVKICFSKNGKSLVISYVIPKKQECTLAFRDVQSFDGFKLTKEEFTNLIQGKTVSYPIK